MIPTPAAPTATAPSAAQARRRSWLNQSAKPSISPAQSRAANTRQSSISKPVRSAEFLPSALIPLSFMVSRRLRQELMQTLRKLFDAAAHRLAHGVLHGELKPSLH